MYKQSMGNLRKLYLRILPDKFHFLKFIIEGYDNLGLLSSTDSKKGVVLLRYPPLLEKEIFELLECISPKLK